MLTTEPEASTLDEYQVAKLPQIEHRGYYYFSLQDDTQIAAQSTVPLQSVEIPGNYFFFVNIDAESATVQAEPILLDESIYEQINLFARGFCTIQARIQTHSYHEVSDTVSTDAPQASTGDLQTEQSVLNIFDTYEHQEFDTDTAYDFTDDLERLIRANDKPVIRIINILINKHIRNNNIISETLKALGRIEDENTKYERYELLTGSIRNQSAIIRDGAVSGLSFLDDKRALPQLRMLFETETIPILKSNIKVAIRSLETY